MTGSTATGGAQQRVAPFSVLVVCTANRCRSPIAEHLLRARCRNASLDWQISSAGVRADDGTPMEPNSAAVLAEHGTEVGEWRSRRLRPEIVGGADLVLTAEVAHRRAVVAMVPRAVRHTFTLLEFAHLLALAGEAAAVPDGDELLRVAARSRALPQARDAGALDIADPIGLPLDAYRDCARVVAGAAARIVP